MRLLLVAPLLSGAGRVPDVFETLGPLLADRGHEVTSTSARPEALLRVTDQVTTALRRRRRTDVTVVHLYSGRAFLTEDVVSAVAGGRLVGVLSGGGLPAFGERHPGWVRRVLGRFDHLVAPSPYLGRWAAAAADTPVTVIPNPLDLAPYPFRARTAVRPTVLWLRAYHDIYAPEVAVEAVALLVDRHPSVRLTMVGVDKGRQDGVRALVTRRGLDDRVSVGGFAGPDEKRALFAEHDVFLNTSRVDNRPVSVVEAAASGLCVVSTDVGGIPDLVEDGASALLVPPDDPGAVAAAIARLVADPALGERISRGGRAVAEAGRPERVSDAWGELLADLAG
jgi:glycosyltransferase involved in cell wall biosynthesis